MMRDDDDDERYYPEEKNDEDDDSDSEFNRGYAQGYEQGFAAERIQEGEETTRDLLGRLWERDNFVGFLLWFDHLRMDGDASSPKFKYIWKSQYKEQIISSLLVVVNELFSGKKAIGWEPIKEQG